MALDVKVIPGAKENRIVFTNPQNCRVYVKAKAVEGKANEAVVEVVSEYFGVKKSAVRILKGHWSRHKVVEIREER